MPIANTTVVTRVRRSSKKDSSKQNERQLKEKRQKEADAQEDVSALFEIRESKYHEDMFARD